MNEKEMVAKLKAFVDANGGNRKAADILGFAHSFIYQVANGERRPTPRLAEALGYEKHITYKEKV